jgi:site-specific DNA-methyltransferase (adenine-specific)
MARNKEPLKFFGEVQMKGQRIQTDFDGSTKPALFYKYPNGQLWHGDSIEWLKSLADESVDLIFADPPYNIKKQIGIVLKAKRSIFISPCNG